MALDLKFGSFNFADPALIGEWSEENKTRIVEVTIPRKDGAYITEQLLGSKIVSVRGGIYESTEALLKSKLDDLQKELNAGEKNLYLYSDRYIPARKQSFGYSYVRGGMKILKFNLQFIAGTPFWLATSGSSDEEVVSSSPKTYTVTTGGKAYSKPKITITANQGVAVSNISLENLTSEEKLSYAGTIAVGKALVIDCGLFTVKNDGSNDISNFTGDFMKLASGNNSIKYTGQNCTIKFEWTDRWY